MNFGTQTYSIGANEKSCIKRFNYIVFMLLSRKVKISKNKLFLKMAVSFDLNEIFKLCFDILKDN